ncbi:MAG: hypothetical protein Q9219_003779 [cf. Caloplaca sp. 3 TL-2023]
MLPRIDMVYFKSEGQDRGISNLDGYGISNVVFGITYTVVMYAACLYLWIRRHHPVVKMRKVSLMISSVLVVQTYCLTVFLVHPLNLKWPCSVEFWFMNLYLPIGIGLWQAQNQQLLIVSRKQLQLMAVDATFKPLMPSRDCTKGSIKYWIWRFKTWYRDISAEGGYGRFVLIGIIIQVI